MGIHYNQGAELLDYVINKEDFTLSGGQFAPLTRPGLGVEINEPLVAARSQHADDWRNPLWRFADGTVAEW